MTMTREQVVEAMKEKIQFAFDDAVDQTAEAVLDAIDFVHSAM